MVHHAEMFVALIRPYALLLAFALCVLLALPAGAWAADEAAATEIKAAFLYKFGGFVEWPPAAFAAADSAYVIGVLEDDALADQLGRISAGRTVQERPVRIRRLRRGESLSGVHTLFVGQSATSGLAEILARARGQPLLVVTDSQSELPAGSVINFVTADDRVRFDVSLAQAEQGRLRISARLLTVARKVISG
jgi:ABC-type amino acid transport substrate-binding protein